MAIQQRVGILHYGRLGLLFVIILVLVLWEESSALSICNLALPSR
jgi:hypothetical protein